MSIFRSDRVRLWAIVVLCTTPAIAHAQSSALPKRVEVFGLYVYGTDAAPDEKLLHAASVLAEYLDSDEDGQPDNQEIVDAMVGKKATMVAAKNSDDLRAYDLPFPNWQNVWTDNIRPNGENRLYNEALEEVLHLITDYGWEVALPEAFARRRGTLAALATDNARGGYFERVPDEYPDGAWFTYGDQSCDYGCMIAEYLHWALSSILGAQDYPGTLERGGSEWPLRTKEQVQEKDPTVYALLTDPKYKLPTVLPDGEYRGKMLTIERLP